MLQSDGILVWPTPYVGIVPPFVGREKPSKGFKTKIVSDWVGGGEFLSTVQEFYPVKRIETELIETRPADGEPEGSQLWHRDTHAGPHCVRAMVYLTDVGMEDGPLCYVRGSNVNPKGNERLTDEGFERLYPRSEWRYYLGLKGTTILFDINGYHKGLKNVKGTRKALVFTYHGR